MPKKTSKIDTQRQRKLIKLITENFGNPETTKTLQELMLLSGYSEESARQQSNILAGIKERLEPIVSEMTEHRNDVVAEMRKKLPKAKYRDLTDALDKLTKNIQLLSGGRTESNEFILTWRKKSN
jgi:hypothetical protein